MVKDHKIALSFGSSLPRQLRYNRDAVRGSYMLGYSTTTGTKIIMVDGRPVANLFSVAYTKNEPGRGLMVCFSGGPGTSSVRMHLSGIGPYMVKHDALGELPQSPPYELVSNSDTVLHAIDLLFLDAIGTGNSHMLPGTDPHLLHGYQADIEYMARYIQWYMENSKRTGPLYLAGASYGAFRACGLAEYLIQHGVPVAGIVLISPVLDYLTTLSGISRGPGMIPSLANILPYINLYPSYAHTAAYHRPYEVELFGSQLEEAANKFAIDRLLPALYRGNELFEKLDHKESDQLRERELDALSKEFSRYTALNKEGIRRRRLRVTANDFCDMFLGNNRVLTPSDTRFYYSKSATEAANLDAYVDHTDRVFPEVLSEYMYGELGYELNQEYVAYNAAVVKKWDWRPFVIGYPNAYSTLSAIMEMSPALKVFVIAGLYDLRCSYKATQLFLDQLSQDHRERITLEVVHAGHTPYIDPQLGRSLASHLEEWILTGTVSQRLKAGSFDPRAPRLDRPLVF